MASSPLILLAIIVPTLVFQALIFGEEYAERSFPNLSETDAACDSGDDGFFAGLSCIVARIAWFFQTLFGIIAFFFNLVSFNVPGAPWFVRAIVGTFMGGGILWSMATLFRGN